MYWSSASCCLSCRTKETFQQFFYPLSGYVRIALLNVVFHFVAFKSNQR